MFKMLILSFIVSLVIGLVFGPLVIKELKKFHAASPKGKKGRRATNIKPGRRLWAASSS